MTARTVPRVLRPPSGPPPSPSAATRLTQAREGSTAIEFGLLALPFLLLVTGIMDCSRMVWTHMALQAAVEQAARCAVVDVAGCGTATQVQAYAASLVTAPGVSASSFSFAIAACGSQVSASMSYAVLVPGYLPASILLTARSCAPM